MQQIEVNYNSCFSGMILFLVCGFQHQWHLLTFWKGVVRSLLIVNWIQDRTLKIIRLFSELIVTFELEGKRSNHSAIQTNLSCVYTQADIICETQSALDPIAAKNLNSIFVKFYFLKLSYHLKICDYYGKSF